MLFMKNIDLQRERELLDREITFFHFKRAKRKIIKCLKIARNQNEPFFFNYFRAQHYILEDNFTRAVHFLDICLTLVVDDGCCYNDKALCFAQLGKYKQALQAFEQGIKVEPECTSLYQNKGWLLHLLGRYKEAMLFFHKAWELDSCRVEALFSIADTYSKLGDSIKAKKYYQKVLRFLKSKCSYMYKETQKRIAVIS